MSKARLVITAVVLEGRPVAQVAADYGVSRSWIYELRDRYRREGDAAFTPRSKRPTTSPTTISDSTVELSGSYGPHSPNKDMTPAHTRLPGTSNITTRPTSR